MRTLQLLIFTNKYSILITSILRISNITILMHSISAYSMQVVFKTRLVQLERKMVPVCMKLYYNNYIRMHTSLCENLLLLMKCLYISVCSAGTCVQYSTCTCIQYMYICIYSMVQYIHDESCSLCIASLVIKC